jgi:ubiquinone/menaquinone biosynthesis C-methylase UbiE
MNEEAKFFRIAADEYDQYARAAWARFVAQTERAQATLAAVESVDVRRALDVGCGAGHELLPLVTTRGAHGVGVDVVAATGRAGRELFQQHAPTARINFARAAVEALPFAAATFDVVICRLALPYTDNARALAEMARVLQPGGVLLLKIHHARYYLDKLAAALRAREARSLAHALRVLTAGTLYQLAGRQPRTRLTGGETFQTRRLLARELARCGLKITAELPDKNATTPSFLISKAQRNA